MDYITTLKERRSFYTLGKKEDLNNDVLKHFIGEILELTPDAFNMQSVRLLVLFDENSEAFWDKVNQTFDNTLDKEKFAGFKNANGTILFFTDGKTVENMGNQFPLYKENFVTFASHAMGMAQINLWNALRTKDLGATLQHYNPIIDTWVKKDYNLPEEWQLAAQMPFGKILKSEEKKEKLPRSERIKVM